MASREVQIQNILRDFVIEHVQHNLYEVMQMLKDTDIDTYMDACISYDYEEAAREAGWVRGEEFESVGPSLEDATFIKALDEFTETAETWEELCNEQDIEPHRNEVYEHWAVDSYLGSHLEERGELVVEILGFTVWGRCCTGQAILLDNVIRQIAKAEGLLDNLDEEETA